MSYIEKRRGRWEIEVTSWRIGEIRRGKSNLASNEIPMCSPQPGTSRERFIELHREEKREEGDRVARKIKGGIKRTKTDQVSNQFPKCSPQLVTHKEIHRVG